MSEVRSRLVQTTIGECTLVHFPVPSLMEDELIEEIGQELYALADGLGTGRLVLNLDGLEFYRSMFLAQLLRLRERVNAGKGSLVFIAGPGTFAHQTFEVAGVVKRLFEIYPTEAEALAAC